MPQGTNDLAWSLRFLDGREIFDLSPLDHRLWRLYLCPPGNARCRLWIASNQCLKIAKIFCKDAIKFMFNSEIAPQKLQRFWCQMRSTISPTLCLIMMSPNS